MKLLKKISTRYIGYSLIILLVGSTIIYFGIKQLVNDELREKLDSTKQRVIKNLISGKEINFPPLVEVKEIPSSFHPKRLNEIKDTVIYNPFQREEESFKELNSLYNLKDKVFFITVRLDAVENSDLIFTMGVPAFLLLLLIIISFNFISNRINTNIWKPFYENLKSLKKYSLINNQKLNLIDSDIDEFEDLNEVLDELTNRLKDDYIKLKEFSENASHEMQTPLAIINAKLDNLLQNEKMDEKDVQQIQTILRTVNRLSKLSKSLTLLTKLESAEYQSLKKIKVKGFIQNRINDFIGLAENKRIKVETKYEGNPEIEINNDLLEILISNLFINAVKHNLQNGLIKISLLQRTLIIKNTGKQLVRKPETMFERFVKGEQSSDSTGLGLTIVKQICDMNKILIDYKFQKPYHIITLHF